MGRLARDDEPERDRPGMGDDDFERGRLGDDRHVASASGPDRGEHPLPAVLLRRHAHEAHVAGQLFRGAGLHDRPERGEDRGHPTLHVAGAAAVEPSVAHGPAERIVRPVRRITDRHDVDVTDEQDARPGFRAGQAADDDRQGRPGHLGAREVRVVGEGDRVDRDAFDLQAHLGHQAGHEVLDPVLRAGDARDTDEGGQVGDGPLPVDGRGRPGREIRGGRGGHPRRIGRVRQVGPPEPLIPISVAG